MKKSLILLFFIYAQMSFAVDSTALSYDWQKTPFELYLNPKEAYDLKRNNLETVLLIDVRNEAEVHYTGMPLITDANIPYRFDSTQWKMKKNSEFGTFIKPKNPYFVQAVDNLLKLKGLNKDSSIIIMCSTGTRAPFAAKALYKNGYTKVYTQIEGFEGIRATEGVNKGKRTVNGWKNRNLPWSYDLRPEKMYFNFSQP